MQAHRCIGNVLVALLAAAPWLAADHTVLVEGASTSWCPHCAVASVEMYALYSSGTYDMCYLTRGAGGKAPICTGPIVPNR